MTGPTTTTVRGTRSELHMKDSTRTNPVVAPAASSRRASSMLAWRHVRP